MGDNIEFGPGSGRAAARIAVARARYERWLMHHRNVVGVSAGTRVRRGVDTGQPCVVVYVTHKEPLAALESADVLPTELDGVPVDVRETGPIVAQPR